jgi:hypothetical protein
LLLASQCWDVDLRATVTRKLRHVAPAIHCVYSLATKARQRPN